MTDTERLVASLLAVAAVLLLSLAAYTSEAPLGECVGVFGPRDPALVYEYDAGNIVVGVVWSETLIVPAIVLFDDLKCPVRRRAK